MQSKLKTLRPLSYMRLIYFRFVFGVVAAMACLIAGAGCMQVIRHEAPYYKEGPHQVEGPDGYYEAGTHVWILGEKDTYVHVLSLGGVGAYVWNQDLVNVWEWREIKGQMKDDGDEAPLFRTSD